MNKKGKTKGAGTPRATAHRRHFPLLLDIHPPQIGKAVCPVEKRNVSCGLSPRETGVLKKKIGGPNPHKFMSGYWSQIFSF